MRRHIGLEPHHSAVVALCLLGAMAALLMNGREQALAVWAMAAAFNLAAIAIVVRVWQSRAD